MFNWCVRKIAIFAILLNPPLGFNVAHASDTTSTYPKLAFITPEQPPVKAGSSTQVPSLSSDANTDVKINQRKPGVESWAPSRAQAADEDYSRLGPGGSATPACPVDDSGCPDINGYVNGQKLDDATIQAQCPSACVRTRQGTLTSGSIPASCPAGYVQVGSYNAAAEWLNPSSSDQHIRVESLEQFLEYWQETNKYDCRGDVVSYGFEVCLPLTEMLYKASPYPDGERAIPSTGMAYNGGQPFATLNPWAGYGGVDAWGLAYGSTPVDQAGLSVLFTNIINSGKVPSIWAPYPSPDGRGATAPEFETEYREQFQEGTYEDGRCNLKEGPEYAVKPQVQLVTYPTYECRTRAAKNRMCNLNSHNCGATDYTLQYEEWAGGIKGACGGELYVKVKLPVWSIACYPKPGAVTLIPNPDGSALHTSIICSRVQPVWK